MSEDDERRPEPTWQELAAQVIHEKDSDKLHGLVEQLIEAIDKKPPLSE